MKRSVVVVSALFVLTAAPAWAQESASAQIEALRRMVEEALSQNADLKKRVLELEEAVSRQGQAPKEPTERPAKEPTKEAAQEAPKEPAKDVAQEAPKEPATAAASEPISTAKGPWGKVQIGGALEVEMFTGRDFRRVRRSELQLTAAEFDFEAKILDWAKAELALEWDRDADTVKLNEAFVTFGHPDFPAYLKTGKGVAPFGIASGSTVAARLEDSLTLKGPLTTDIFEAKEEQLLVGFKNWGFQVGGYLFNGSTNKVGGGGKRLDHYGFTAGYAFKGDPVSVILGASWINSVFDTDGLTGAFPELQEPRFGYVPGVGAYVKLGLWGFSVIAEYITAIHNARFIRTMPDDTLRTFNVQPEAWQVEVGYTTDILFDRKTYVAFNYSESASLLAKFAKNRLLATLGVWLSDNVRVAGEYKVEQDYSKVQLGTNNKGETWTLRLTYEW